MTYSDAGVDIDSGNSLVQAIKPLAKSTTRPGCDAMLGGFGALFDLKAAGFIDPVLVSGTDGVGTKLKVGHTCEAWYAWLNLCYMEKSPQQINICSFVTILHNLGCK